MARRAWWPTVETSEATIFARGIVTPAVCAEAKRDCCDPPAAESPCCPDGFEEVLLFSALGPLGANFAATLLEYELNWNPTRGSWIGGQEDESGAAIAFETYCVEDEEIGTLWVVAGSYFAVELGVHLPFFTWGVLPGNGTIVAEVEVPGSDTPLTIVIAHPCPTEENGGGSGGSSGSGSGSGSGTLTCPSCTDTFRSVPFTLNDLSAAYSGTGGSGSLAMEFDFDDFDWDGTLYGSVVSVTNECLSLADANRWQITVGGALIQDDIAATTGSSNTVSVTFTVPYTAFTSPPGGATGNVSITVTGTLC